MTDDQLDAIETTLGLTLPPAYRRVSRMFPFRPIGLDRVYWFFDDPNRVIHGTRFPLEDGGYAGPALPPRYVAIGQSGGGDLYLLDTAAEGLPVVCLSHETHAVEPAWPTFEAFVEEWVRAPGEIAKERAVEQAAASARQRQLWLVVGVPLVIALLLALFALLALGLAARR
jgi:hypothetical protein